MNHAILGELQDVFNLLPNLSNPSASTIPQQLNGTTATRTESTDLARAMSIKSNDQMMAIYLSSLIRAITAFHDLIENKIQNRQQQEEKDSKKEGGKDEKGDKKVDGAQNGESQEDKEGVKEGKEKGKEPEKKK